jgi:hypothetical protein
LQHVSPLLLRNSATLFRPDPSFVDYPAAPHLSTALPAQAPASRLPAVTRPGPSVTGCAIDSIGTVGLELPSSRRTLQAHLASTFVLVSPIPPFSSVPIAPLTFVSFAPFCIVFGPWRLRIAMYHMVRIREVVSATPWLILAMTALGMFFHLSRSSPIASLNQVRLADHILSRLCSQRRMRMRILGQPDERCDTRRLHRPDGKRLLTYCRRQLYQIRLVRESSVQ